MTLPLALGASLGSILPLLILAPERIGQPQRKVVILGTVIALAGIILCGYAGILRERSDRVTAVPYAKWRVPAVPCGQGY
jgi:L-rhamnose-H+ transport protein